MNWEDDYKKLKKKYKHLPDAKWLKENFKIKIEIDEAPLLEQIRAAIFEKLDSTERNMIEPIISANENLCCFFERKMVTLKERERLFEYYKEIQTLLWKSNELSIYYDEKKCADWMKEVREMWERIKPKLIEFCDKFYKGWKNFKEKETETLYHG